MAIIYLRVNRNSYPIVYFDSVDRIVVIDNNRPKIVNPLNGEKKSVARDFIRRYL